MLTTFGVIADAPAADAILSQIPLLVFIIICAVIILRWADIHHYAMQNNKSSPVRKVGPFPTSIGPFVK